MKRLLSFILILLSLLPLTVATGSINPPPDSYGNDRSQDVELTLDGVSLSLQTPFLPAESFLAPEPDDPVQVASAVDFGEIFKSISITAVPYGTKSGAEALPTAQPQSAEVYRELLAQHRRLQGGRPQRGPVATLFGQQITGSATTVDIYVSVFAPQPVHIIEWVVEAGNRLWIIRISQEAMPPVDNAPLSAQEERFTTQLVNIDLSSPNLDTPSTSAAAKLDPPPPSQQPPAQPTFSDLPFPAWWDGDCDKNTYHADTGIWAYPLGGIYRNMKACGPRPWGKLAGSPVLGSLRWAPAPWISVQVPST